MKILITGAAGKLGTAVRKELAGKHELRLADITKIENPEGESLVLDIADVDAVQRAMEGMEAVAHLAYGNIFGGVKDAEAIRISFDVNARGTYNLLWAAHKVKAKRFLYSSTLSVHGKILGKTKDLLDESTPPCPNEVYGFTKYLGEEACRYFADNYGMDIVVLRLCQLRPPKYWARDNAPEFKSKRESGAFGMSTHVADVARAIHLSLTKSLKGYQLIHIASDNKGRITKIDRAKELLGFTPEYRLDSGGKLS